ncbi:SoxR reducing system RseC family protein [candidate division KSB1 bacterium]|nr:SoxR reducing system RseC family protein [candidate division KSB1 bacterium]
MRELGEVLRIDEEKAYVRIAKSEHCAGCNACDMFDNGRPRELIVRNSAAAQVGDLVEIDINPKSVVKASFLIFIFPIIAMILGYVLGKHLSSHLGISAEPSGIIGSVACLALSFLAIFIYDKSFATDTPSASIIAIVKKTTTVC